MSKEVVQEVIIKAVSDPEFRELLFSDPDKALEGFELTEEEAETIKQLEKERFNESLSELEERVSRSSNFPIGGGVSAQQNPYEELLPEQIQRLLQFKPPSPPKIFG